MKILVAEDDVETAEYIRRGLVQNGHSVESVRDGRDAATFCLYNSCDVLVLDWMMPGMDGLSVLKTLRAANCSVRVIFLTARADVDDRVEGLLAGADDYLVKPFLFSELLARLIALNRRPTEFETKTTLAFHDLELDVLRRRARRGGADIDLLGKEFALLEVLMRNPERIVTRTMLLEKVWDFSFDPKTTVVETHMCRLRAKIDRPFQSPLITTIRNSGYMLRAPS